MARRERRPGALDHDRPGLGVGADRLERADQLLHQLERERVPLLRTVQRDPSRSRRARRAGSRIRSRSPRAVGYAIAGPVHLSPLTPLAFLERSAAAFPDRVAVVDGERQLTWAEFRERARRLACALQAHGIEHGDRVAFLAPNGHELLEAHFGVPRSGAVLVAINTRLMPEEIGYILEHSGARLLVVDPTLEHLVPEDAQAERILRCGDSYEEFLAGAPDGEPEPRLQTEDDTISINYTSGTTGRPKGVMYTHRGAYLNALAEMHHARLDSRSVYLWTLPMFHCNGWCFTWARDRRRRDARLPAQARSAGSSGGSSTRPA